MKLFITILFCFTIVSCMTSRHIDISNACNIFKSEPRWKSYTTQTKEKWGVPISLQLAFIHQESSFQRNAKPPRDKLFGVLPSYKRISSAKGYSQALDGTWNDYKESTGNSFASRGNFADASDFIGWYINGSNKLLGLSKSDVYNQYLAYHEGRGGYQKKSYNKKKWLIDVAKKVERQAVKYSSQLKNCKASKHKFSVL